MENIRQRVQTVLEQNQSKPYTDTKKLNQITQIKSKAHISVSIILLMLDIFPNLSAEWLLRGKGNMYEENKLNSSNPEDETYEEIHNKIISLEAENKLLREIVGLPAKEMGRVGMIAL